MGFFKMILILGAIAAGVYFGAQWLDRNPRSVDIQKISPPVHQLPGPQNPYPK